MTVVATGVMNATFSTILVFVGVAAARGAQAPTRTEIARSPPIAAPLRALTTNPNYFTDGSGKAVYLTGSHTWNDFQDWGADGSPQPFNFVFYVKMLVAHHHNFTLLWQTELPTFRNLPTQASNSPDFTVTPQGYACWPSSPRFASGDRDSWASACFSGVPSRLCQTEPSA